MDMLLETIPGLAVETRVGARDRLLGDIDTHIEYAFQPIVNIHTGVAYGFEALLRGHERIGFASIRSLLDHINTVDAGVAVDETLRRKAMAAFRTFASGFDTRLFFNLDNRILSARDHRPAATAELLNRYGIPPSFFCIEISEADAVVDVARAKELLRASSGNILIAIDDFGTGHSGLQLLCESHPDLIKVDRFFIAGIERDQRKKVFLATIVNLAHVLGIAVIAEGIETEAEFRICREIGCDLAQGYFIARPSVQLHSLLPRYDIVVETNRTERRERQDTTRLLREQLDKAPAISITAEMQRVFDSFRREKTRSFFPVVDDYQQPVGVIHEADLKEFVYSPYGKDVLSNRGAPFKLRKFLTPCMVCDVNTPIDQILEAFAMRSNDPGILIVEDSRYLGLLDAGSMIRIMNERNLMLARNENPLTKLPGNSTISDYIAQAFDDEGSGWSFAYFDLDHFKAFNDRFGFRQGDRAILLFADLLRRIFDDRDVSFIGHIGGDDFFVGARGLDHQLVRERVSLALDIYGSDAASFYDHETREAGFIEAVDRHGERRRFPLLSASCALLHLPAGRRMATSDSIYATLADLKKAAKCSPTKLVVRTLS